MSEKKDKSEYLLKDPIARKERAQEKEMFVLDYLRDEVYSSTKILANIMCVGDRAARNALNKMEQKGLIVRDEIQFMGARAVTLWGITSAGIMHEIDPEDVQTISLRNHKVNTLKALTIEHSLDVQWCRIYCETDLDFEDWIPDRLLPGKGAKKGHPLRWHCYPDAVAKKPLEGGDFIKVAIEVERSRKTPSRYVQIINSHLRNIRDGRYRAVIYFCKTKKEADSFRVLFHRLIDEKKISLLIGEKRYSMDDCKKLFGFWSMESAK